ncbi:hypothetical protein [Constantimarinum furrinae]|uniref:Uncharacterized protein n=1 Tax=Constantimarinum furrinae TaxID=2562285 RepID=A0A7G8PWU9_9FLAO|nr:hypothetical protein [Constantimarinum furrinae]QNJ98815.1 hypothetical protein ALE3EI_2272 [Constantimarinum furrinae]
MSPALRKLKEQNSSESDAFMIDSDATLQTARRLSIAHNASKSVSLLEDWMIFTNVLGIGIINRIS